MKADHFDVSFQLVYMIIKLSELNELWSYVDESWSLWRELSSSLYDHLVKWTRWILIYVFAMHVNRSENRKIDRFTTSHRCVCAQKLSCAFAITVWMLYISCSVCAKTLLSFCVYASFNTLMIALLLLRFSTVC